MDGKCHWRHMLHKCDGEMASGLLILYMVLPTSRESRHICWNAVEHLFFLFSAGSKHACPCASLSRADHGSNDNFDWSDVSRFAMDDKCSMCMTAECRLDHTQIESTSACSQASPVQLLQKLAEHARDGECQWSKNVTANCLLDHTHTQCMLYNIIDGTASMEVLQEMRGCAMHNKYQWSKGIRAFACMSIHNSGVPERVECVMEHFQQSITSGCSMSHQPMITKWKWYRSWEDVHWMASARQPTEY